jgi:hypothetical protein
VRRDFLAIAPFSKRRFLRKADRQELAQPTVLLIGYVPIFEVLDHELRGGKMAADSSLRRIF